MNILFKNSLYNSYRRTLWRTSLCQMQYGWYKFLFYSVQIWQSWITFSKIQEHCQITFMSNESAGNGNTEVSERFKKNQCFIALYYPFSTRENQLPSKRLISSHTCDHMRYRCVSLKYLRRSTMRIL